MATDIPESRQPAPWKLSLIILLLVAACYANTLNAPFIFDDDDSIVHNPYIRSIWPLTESMKAPPQTTVAGRPIVSLTLALNYALSGHTLSEDQLWSWHLVNTLIHGLAAITLFGVIRRLLNSKRLQGTFGPIAIPLAAVVAAIWAVHPLQTGAVTYIIQRAESLMGLFHLLAMYCAIRHMTCGARHWMIGAVIASALGMATKEVMVTAPVVILLIDRCFFAGTFLRALRARPLLYVGLAATWLVLIAANYDAPRSKSAGLSLETVTPLSYFLTQLEVIPHYLLLVFRPVGQCLDYQWPLVNSWRDVLPQAMLMLALGVTTLIGLARNTTWSLPAVAFFLILAPTSSFVPLVDPAFEHRMYLPSACVVAIAVCLFAGYFNRLLRRRFNSSDSNPPATQQLTSMLRQRLIVFLIIVPILMLLTHRRNETFQSVESVWRTVVDARPENNRAHINLANALLDNRKIEEAVSHYEIAIKSGAFALQAYNNFADALRRLGRFEESVFYLREAIKLDPAAPEPRSTLGNVLMDMNDFAAAANAFEEAATLDSRNPLAWYNLGYARRRAGRNEDAVTAFERSLQESNGIPETHYMLGLARLDLGEYANALASFDRAIALAPDWLPPIDRRAWIFATAPQYDDKQAGSAIRDAVKVNEATGMSKAAYLDTLAAAYAAAGNYEDAVSVAEKALALAPSQSPELVEPLTERIKLYRAGKRYIAAPRVN